MEGYVSVGSIVGIVVIIVGILASVALHEVGHMLPAKKFGVLVPDYAVGFGPALWKKKIGDTTYALRAILLGGYVKIVGMYAPARPGTRLVGRGGKPTLAQEAREASAEEIPQGQEHRAFYLLSAPKKVVVMLGGPLMNLLIAVGVSAVPNYARIVRGSVLSIRGMEFVEAARSVGSSDLRIILKHILPNSMAPIIVQSTLGVASAILNAAGLSFIGLGIQPPNPEWGAMLSGGRQYIRDSPHLTLYPGLAIMFTILALNFLGDGLRDALDPKLKR